MHIADHLAMVMSFGVIIDTRVNLFRDNPDLAVCVHKCMRQAALSDVTISATQIVVLQLIHVFLADDEHLRKVIRALSHTEQFGFHK